MKTTIELLKDQIDNAGITIDGHRVFEMLAAVACEQCCTSSSGGNGSCPPPKKIAE
jgi:hypothetical protein